MREAIEKLTEVLAYLDQQDFFAEAGHTQTVIDMLEARARSLSSKTEPQSNVQDDSDS